MTTIPETTAISGRFGRRFKRRRPVSLVLAGAFLLLMAVLVVAGQWIVPDPMKQDILNNSLGFGASGHLFGTDDLGRDVLKMAVGGARSSLIGPLVVAIGSMTLGVLLGTLAGYRRGWTDIVVSRWTDLLLALPAILLAIVVAGIFGAGYWITVAVFIVLFSPSDIRMLRAAVMEQAPRPYVESARMLGLSQWRVMYRHILPNITRLVLANVLLDYAFAIVAMASLSFLGIGVNPGVANWGRQLADGQEIMLTNPWTVAVPAILIILVACAVNLLGDALGSRAEDDR